MFDFFRECSQLKCVHLNVNNVFFYCYKLKYEVNIMRLKRGQKMNDVEDNKLVETIMSMKNQFPRITNANLCLCWLILPFNVKCYKKFLGKKLTFLGTVIIRYHVLWLCDMMMSHRHDTLLLKWPHPFLTSFKILISP